MTHSIEICRDLKRLAGIVNKDGWSRMNGFEPVGGMIALSGPVLIYDSHPIELGIPGYYSRQQIQEAYSLMYGYENLPRPKDFYLNLEADTGKIAERLLNKLRRKHE